MFLRSNKISGKVITKKQSFKGEANRQGESSMKLQLCLELAREKKCCSTREGKKDSAQESKILIDARGVDCNPCNTRKSEEYV